MATSPSSPNLVRFDAYEVDLRAQELYKGGRRIRLQVQPFHVLAMLLEHPGEVLTRDELRKRLWPEDTFVDFDHSLNTAVKKLRQALSDDQKKPKFVETLPKRGYRFIGTVKQAAAGHSAATPAVVTAPAKTSVSDSSWTGRVAKVRCEDGLSFALVAVDGATATERAKLDAANDDVGLSLLIASLRLLMVADGTPLRILELEEAHASCLVRILEGEHYGKTALVPIKLLATAE